MGGMASVGIKEKVQRCGPGHECKTFQAALDAAADGDTIEIWPDCPAEDILVIIKSEIHIRGAREENGRPMRGCALKVASLMVHTFAPMKINDLIIEGAEGYCEALVQANADLVLNNVCVKGGGNGLVVVNGACVRRIVTSATTSPTAS